MKLLKLIFWLTAWSVWLWLGFGLYRELPRDLGPTVCKLPLHPKERFEGFLRGKPSAVTKGFDPSTAKPIFRKWSATTGNIELEIPGVSPDTGHWTFTVSVWHGYVIGYDQTLVIGSTQPEKIAELRKKLTGEVRVTNLQDGRERVFPDLGTLTTTHVTKPWALFCRNIGDDERAVIIDLETGGRILEQKIPGGGFANGWLPYFVGAEHFAVPIPNGVGGFRLEIRSIQTGELVRTFDDGAGNYVTVSTDGKIAWYEYQYEHPIRLVVHDLSSGGRLLVDEAPPHGGMHDQMYPPRFSSDGRLIFSPGSHAVVDLIGGRRVWESAKNEKATLSVSPDRFEVAETWTLGVGSWWKTFKTFALRRMNDGSFIDRTWISTAYPSNQDRTLLFLDGAIHRLPPRVNWLLLAIGQSILALPLVLLWAIPRWRRRRRASRERERPEASA